MGHRAVVLALVLAACGGSATDSGSSNGGQPTGAPMDPGGPASPGGSSGATASGGPGAPPAPTTGRDWSKNPALVDLPAPPIIYAVSDVHGGFARLATLLYANGLLTHAPASATDAHWAAASATLVVAGDLIDKGPSSVEVIDFLMALQADASKSAGAVVVTLGNHEAEFLADPTNSKASGPDGIDPELARAGVLPATFASPTDPRGAWLRRLPFGARLGAWFFSHAGDTRGRTLAALGSALEAAVKTHADYNDPEILGSTSIVESRDWYAIASTVVSNAAALGVKHIVMGHDPNALGARGKIAVAPGNGLIRIDCGMSPGVDDSTGKLLRVRQQGANDVVDELDASAQARALFQSPR